jgi:hypothetical protein
VKVLVVGLVCLGSLAFVGCDEEAPPGNSSRRAVVPAADVTGHWEMDVEGFVNANWKLFAEGPRKVAEAARKERARLAELGVAERAAAEQRLQDKMDKLPADQREMVEAVLGTPDQLKAAILKLVRQRMANDCVTLDFHTGGTPRAPGRRRGIASP